MGNHDASYKRLFSHPRMIGDLLVGFVHEDWVGELDLTTLEKVGSSYVTPDAKSRESDIVWRVRFKGRWLYIYVLLEFQSQVDRLMALRLMVYVGLLYQDLIRQGLVKRRDKLPPVLPIVLYNGKGPWDAVQDVSELIEPFPGGHRRYQPRMSYFLLDERRLGVSELKSVRNISAALFRLEKSREPEDIDRLLASLAAVFRDPELESLEKELVDWITQTMLAAKVPGQEIPKVQRLQEVRTMLADRVVEWTQEWQEEGRQKGLKEGLEKGLEKGLKKGRKEGTRELVLRLLERRFGPLSKEARRKVVAIRSSEELTQLAERILTASSLGELGLE